MVKLFKKNIIMSMESFIQSVLSMHSRETLTDINQGFI